MESMIVVALLKVKIPELFINRMVDPILHLSSITDRFSSRFTTILTIYFHPFYFILFFPATNVNFLELIILISIYFVFKFM